MIKTAGSINDVLNRHNAREWTSPANLGKEKFDFSKLEKMNITPSTIKENRKSFAEFLANSIGEVNKLQTQADKAIERLITGESKNIHATMLAVERADIAFKTMNQIRMKVISAYQEIMRMQV